MVLEVCRRFMGEEHFETRAALFRLSDIYFQQGKLREAEQVLRQLLPSLNKQDGDLEPLASGYGRLTAAFEQAGQTKEADAARQETLSLYKRLLAKDPVEPRSQNNLAWFLVTCRNAQFRYPARAVELARKAVERQPVAYAWNTLGVALYRADDWKAAIDALEKAEALEPDVSLGINGFFLAMARWQLGQKEEARTWYDKAVAWMEKIRPKDEGLLRFRAEAAALLGLSDLPADVFARP
jgi:tetratricopeptide (TPR) repeat protein